MNDGSVRELVAKIRQVAYELHAYLGTGLLEKVYGGGLCHRLAREGLKVETQKPLRVFDYLKITGVPAVLLINFGSYKFEVRTVIPRFPTSTSSTLLHG